MNTITKIICIIFIICIMYLDLPADPAPVASAASVESISVESMSVESIPVESIPVESMSDESIPVLIASSDPVDSTTWQPNEMRE